MSLSRRNLLMRGASMLVLATVGSSVSSGFASAIGPVGPFRFSTTVERDEKAPGVLVRHFDGPAAPPASLVLPDTGERVEFYEQFPNPRDPYAVNTKLKLGRDGFGLRTIARGSMGVIPGDTNEPWPLNMIPFGVAVDGSTMDPSGPWYDGGPADPNNPFDRKCTGWEYEVTHPDVMKLVGVPSDLQGHVQPGGMFHYHGYPSAMISVLRGGAPEAAGPLVVGYSADGFPIIDYRIATSDGSELILVSGYVVRQGQRKALERTNPEMTPAGDYDGLFVQDYVFDPQAKRRMVDQTLHANADWHGAREGDVKSGKVRLVYLNANNALVLGRDSVPSVESYPSQHYAYVLTPDWPKIPRQFAMEPDGSFRNIVPFESSGVAGLLSRIGIRAQPTRSELYANCPGTLQHIRALGRKPY